MCFAKGGPSVLHRTLSLDAKKIESAATLDNAEDQATLTPPAFFLTTSSRNHGCRKEQEVVQGQEGFEEENGPVREEGLVPG